MLVNHNLKLHYFQGSSSAPAKDVVIICEASSSIASSPEVFIDGCVTIVLNNSLKAVASSPEIGIEGFSCQILLEEKSAVSYSLDVYALVLENLVYLDVESCLASSPNTIAPVNIENIEAGKVNAFSPEIKADGHLTTILLNPSSALAFSPLSTVFTLSRPNVKSGTVVFLDIASAKILSPEIKDFSGTAAESPFANIFFKTYLPYDGICLEAPVSEIKIFPKNSFLYFDIPNDFTISNIYQCILTGEADGLADLVLPISSFHARIRTGEPSFCEVIVPDVDRFLDPILLRPNGEIVVFKGNVFLSGIVNYVEIARVDFTDIAYDKGPSSSSISLSGHKETINDIPKIVSLQGVQVESLQKNGKYRVRCGVDFFARPGDTILWDDKSIIVDLLSISVNKNIARMEITGV